MSGPGPAAAGGSGPGPDAERSEIVYVSWGGTGRAAALRRALGRAHETGRGLVYLAVLDDSNFGDIDHAMLELAKDELSWLLDAQLELTKQQTGIDEVPVRVLVRSGDVADQIVAVVDSVGSGVTAGGSSAADTEVLIGAPVPTSGHATISDLLGAVSSRVEARVSIIDP